MSNSSGILRDGDQFELDLFPGVPWEGRRPRGLTRVGSGLFLRPEPPGHEVEKDPAQLELFTFGVRLPRGKRPPQAAGAPLLLPLKSGRVDPRSRRVHLLRGKHHG